MLTKNIDIQNHPYAKRNHGRVSMLRSLSTRTEIRLAICCPSPALRTGLELISQHNKRIQLVSSTAAYKDLQAPSKGPMCDVLIADLTIDTQKNLSDLKEFQRLHPDVKVMALIEPTHIHVISSQAAPDIRCYQVATSAPEEILANIEAVSKGQSVVASCLAEAYVSSISQKQFSKNVSLLSQRQTQVLKMIAKGKTNGEIAGALRISEPTVKFHIKEIFSRLCVKNRTEAARLWSNLKLAFSVVFLGSTPMLEVALSEI